MSVLAWWATQARGALYLSLLILSVSLTQSNSTTAPPSRITTRSSSVPPKPSTVASKAPQLEIEFESRPFNSLSSHGETSWYWSKGPRPIEEPPAEVLTAGVQQGYLYVHYYSDDEYQIWVFRDGTWVEAKHGIGHPFLHDRMLSMRQSDQTPSWILKTSQTTMLGRKVKAKRRS